MPPRIHGPLSSVYGGRASGPRIRFWLCVLVAALVGGYAFTHRFGADAHVAEHADQTLSPACQQWHQTASRVVANLLDSTRDADLRQVNDLVFRLRRALRNCEEGWIILACQDYQSVVRTMPGRLGMHKEALFACSQSDKIRSVADHSSE